MFCDVIIMTVAIDEIDPVHLMNADSQPGGHLLSNHTNRLGLSVHMQAATVHIHNRHLLLLSIPKALNCFIGRR